MRPSKPILGTLLITSAMGLALAACNRNTPAQQPLSSADLALPATAAATSPGPVYDRYGPPPKKIPVGRVTNPRDEWAWAERSYALDNAFFDTAPDYGFYYDDDEPWVWQTSDRWAMYGDPYDYGYDWDDDGYYYYYQPGAVRPYFIRDAYYGYGFDDVGRLVVIYDLLGRIMPQSFLYEREPYVSRYYQRAYQVRQASLRVQPVVVTQAVWQERAPVIQRYQSRWIEAARTQPQWVDYRQRTGDRFVRAFERDRQQRQQRTFATNGQPQQGGGFLGRNREAQPGPVAQNDQNRRGFFSLGGRDRQPPQLSAQPPLARADHGGRDWQRQDRMAQAQVQSQAQANQDRRGFFTGRDRGADQTPQRQLEAQARQEQGRQRQEMARQQQGEQRQDQGRQRQEMARQRQAEQRQAEAQARQDQGRQRQEVARQQQAQQRQAEAQARQDQGRQRQEMARQQQAQQRQAEAQARQDQGRQRQEMARQQEAQQRQAEAQARQDQGRQRQEMARQQQAQQRQAEAEARQQQQAQQRQAEAQARQQQQAQQRQAEAEARQQQQAQQRQAEAQARQQQQAQQRQAEAQARQQQAQQVQAKQQQRAQQPQKGQEADAQPAQNSGHGHGKKG